MGEFAEIFGWITVWGFIFEIFNFIVKQFNKRYISKLPREKQKIIDLYRKIMKFIVKYHKVVGVITITAAIAHFAFMLSSARVRLSGLIGIGLMVLLLGLGLYGAYINKNYKGKWLKVHRALAISLGLIIVIHLL